MGLYHILSNQEQTHKYCWLIKIIIIIISNNIVLPSSDEAGASVFRRIIYASSLRQKPPS